MTIKRKQQAGARPLVVVAGSSRQEAERLFVSVANAQGHVTLTDGRNQFVTEASAADMFNPFTGDSNLRRSNSQMTALSGDDNENVTVDYTVCADGCGAHIMSESSVQFCPSCSTELPELSDEEIASMSEDGDVEEGSEEPHAVVAADSAEEARDLFQQVVTSEDTVTYTSESGTYVSHSSVEFNHNPVTGEADLTQAETPKDFSVEASDSGKVAAHLYVCANSHECGKTIISTSSDAVTCPSCGGGLVDPADLKSVSALEDLEDLERMITAQASSDEEDEEDEEDEDFSDLDSDDEDMSDIDELDEGDEELDAELAALDEEDADEEEDEDELESESSDDEEDEELEDEELEDDGFEDEEDDELESESSDDDLEEELEEEEEEEEESEEDLEDLSGLELEEDEELESESSVVDELDIDLLTAIAASDTENPTLNPQLFAVANCGVIAGTPTWTAFYKGIPVATALASNATGKIAEMFETPRFGQAVVATANADGIEVALDDFGFKRISPELNIHHVVEAGIMQKAEARVNDIQAQASAERDQMLDRFSAAISTALMGVNRGVFKGKANPVATRLMASLSAAGVANPSQLVQDAFAQCGDALNKIVMDVARDLVAKSPEEQNVVGEMVMNASVQMSAVASEDNSLQSRLQPRPRQQEVPQMASESSSQQPAKSSWRQLLQKSRTNA